MQVVKDLEVRQAEVESRAPLMNMRVEEFKEHLRSLHISEARYAELKAMPDEALHVLDLVKVRSHARTHTGVTCKCSGRGAPLHRCAGTVIVGCTVIV